MSHPNPRSVVPVAGCCGEVILATVAAVSTPLPPSSIACANRAKSSAVENTPACPATPPIRRAVRSCTTPRKER